MKSKNWTILILISLCLCAQQTLAQTAPKTVVEEIIIKAKDFNLGRPRSESPDPRQTPTPRNQGWWQAFEGGWVYWSPNNGPHVVRGKIFDVWGQQGWEQGRLSFPVADEEDCRVPDSNDRYQRFEGGVIHWRASTYTATVYNNGPQGSQPFGVNGVCYPTQTVESPRSTVPLSTNRVAPNISIPAPGPQTAPPPADKKPQPLARSRGLFRITIVHFIADHVVHNGVLDAGDDAFLMWDAQEFNADGRLVGWPLAGQSLIYGDMGRNRANIQAGTQGDNGGIRSGDKISGRLAPSANRLPMLVGDFELVDGENAWVFAPTVWTAENEAGNLPYLHRQMFQLRSKYAGYEVRHYLEEPLFAEFRWIWGHGRGVDEWFNFRFPWGMNNTRGDRPIGAVHFWIQMNSFIPDFYLLTYKTVTDFMRSAGGRREVPFETHYSDIGGGEYTIAMTIERVK